MINELKDEFRKEIEMNIVSFFRSTNSKIIQWNMNAFVDRIETKVATRMLSACIIAITRIHSRCVKATTLFYIHALPCTLEMLSLSLRSSITLLKTTSLIFCFVPTAIKRPYLKSRAENRKFCNVKEIVINSF